MKKHYQKLIISGFFLFASFVFAQFNTLKPIVPKTDSKTLLNKENIEKTQPEKEEKRKKERTYLKKIFGTITKTDLKNEMDSLKTMMKEYSSVNNQKWDVQNSKDSLILKAQTKKLDSRKSTNSFSEYDFVEEPGEDFSKIVMPLKNKITVTSPYGTRTHPVFGTKKMHNGIDLKASYENVYSVLDGIVTQAGWDNKGGGNYIKIRHFNQFETAYLHLSEIYYRVGEFVKAGFVIAKSGNSGNSTGPHLHFSVKEFGQSINPTHFLNDLIKANNLIATYYAK